MNGETNYFLDKLLQPSQTELFGPADLLLAMSVAALLCFVLANIYRQTHRGTSYSQSFIVTLFMMSVATAVVMMIIGSNIARAFSLVGALSIIRFRTAVKDSRDTGYLFSRFVRGGGYLNVEHAVRKITADTAQIWGLPDRGLLRAGMAADVVVFDPDTIARGAELPARDMPEGGMRYVRDASGVDAVIVNGELTWSQKAGYTDARPGVVATA